MSLQSWIQDTFARARVMSGRRTAIGIQGEPPALAQSVTVPKLHSILRLAEAGECQELFSLYREICFHAHTQTVINQRKLAALTKTLTIVPEDPNLPDDVNAANASRTLTRTPGWLNVAMNHLLNGHMYPLAVLEQVYEAAPANEIGILYRPKEWAPVPYHLLDWTAGKLQIWDADMQTGFRLGTRSVPCETQYIIHRGHLLSHIPDNWGGPMRAALFWWLFATMDRDWWIRFLDRFGAPFLVGKYDTADSKSRNTLANAFSAATKLFGIVCSKDTDIEVIAVSSNSHGEAFERFQAFANGELSKLFLGQTMTVTAQAGGLGGAQAEVQDNARGDIEAWDLTVLSQTVNSSIIEPFLRLNGIRGRAIMQVATDSAKDLDSKTKFLEVSAKAGLEPTDKGIEILSKASGIPMQRSTRPAVLPGAPTSTFSASTVLPGPSAEQILAHLHQPSDADLDRIAQAGAPGLAAAFRGRYAGIPHLIALSTSSADLEHRLHLHFADLPGGRLSAILSDALETYAALGAGTARQP